MWQGATSVYQKYGNTCRKCYKDCPSLPFGISSKELQTHGAEVLSLSYALRLAHALPAATATWDSVLLCPVLSSISFLPVPGKGSAGNGDHPSLNPLSSLSPLHAKVRHSPLTSSSVSPSGNTLWRGTVCRFCREAFAGTWLNLQHFSGLRAEH